MSIEIIVTDNIVEVTPTEQNIDVNITENPIEVNVTDEIVLISKTGLQGPVGPGVAIGGTAGQILSKNSATDYDTLWIDNKIGTVTSVNASGGNGISVSGVPITSSGTINIINTAPDQIVSLTGAGTTLINGTYPNFTISSADQYIGTVTSINMSVPTGLTISGNPITSSGTLAIGLATGYSIPTNANQTNWNTAYNDSIVSASVTGTTTKTLTLNQQDGGSLSTSWSDIDTGLTSVGLSMPVAFSVANTPLTSNGTLAVTAIGTSAQYIRGDGQLATLPSGASGGSSINYYLNGSVNQGTIGGSVYYEMNRNAIIGTGTDFTRTNASGDGLIAQFITDVADPNRLEIPGGAWNFEMFFSASSNGGTPSFYVELLKYDGTTFTSIASNVSNPEIITGGTLIDLYLSSLAVPQTTLLATDRLAIRVYVTTNGKDITLHTEDNHLCEIVTTFAGGVSSLNGLTANTQYFAVGTSGTDFAINSLTDTHTFNLPTASSTNRGALSSADWTSFNNKYNLPSLTNGSVLFSNGTTITQDNANFFWDDTNNRFGIGTNTPAYGLDVNSTSIFRNNILVQAANGRYVGFDGFTTGMTVDFRFGDINNRVANTYGSTMNIESYHGVVLSNSNLGSVTNAALRVLGRQSGKPILELVGGSTVYGTMFYTGNFSLGNVVDSGYRLDVTGTTRLSNTTIINAATVGGLLQIKGTGTTSSTYQIYTQNSTGTTLFYVRDDGVVSATNISANSGTYGSGTGTQTSLTATGGSANLQFQFTSGSNIATLYNSGGGGITLKTLGSASALVISNAGAGTFASSVTATSIIKSGGTSTQYLMADGSTTTLTNPVTGTGASGQISYWSGTNTITSSSDFSWNNTSKYLVANIGLSGYVKLAQTGWNSGFIQTAYSNFIFGSNLRYDGSQWVYDQTGFGAQFQADTANGYIQLNTTISGTAGTTATIQPRLRILNDGRTLLGTSIVTDDTTSSLQVGGSGRFTGTLKLDTINAATTDTDKFLVSDSGIIKFRTGAEILSDIGAQAALTNPITGTGTTNYIAKFTGTSALGDSTIFDNGTNVGIGTASPLKKLTVSGTAGSTMIALENIGIDYYGIGMPSGSGDLAFYSSTLTERMRITTTGNVGIGTISPNSPLHVGASTNFAISGRIASVYAGADSTTIFTIGRSGIDYPTLLNFGVNNASQYATISVNQFTAGAKQLILQQDGGNVGIGTTSPNTILSVVKTETFNGFTDFLQLADNTNGLRISDYWDAGGIRWDFRRGTTSIMSFSSANNLLIGTVSDTGLYKIDVNGAGRFSSTVTATNTLNVLSSGTPTAFIKTTADSGTDATLYIGGARTGNATADIGGLQFWNYGNQSTSGQYAMGIISGRDPSANSTLKNGALVFQTSNGGVLAERMRIDNLGAATFTSSVKATSFAAGSGTNLAFIGAGYFGFYNAASSAKYIQLDDDSSSINAVGFSKSGSVATVWFPNGNVGIGTTSPTSPLQVHRTTANTDVRIALTDATTTDAVNKGFNIIKGSDQNGYIYNYENFNIIIGTNATERMRITSGGNVLINTTSDTGLYKLDVNGAARFSSSVTANDLISTSYGTARIQITSTTNSANSAVRLSAKDSSGTTKNAGLYYVAGTTTATTFLSFAADDINYQFNFLANGNVGIGTTSPNDKLQVSGTGNLGITISTTGNTATDYAAIRYNQGSSDIASVYTNQGNYIISTAGATRLTLNASGNLGLGVTPSAWNLGKAFEINDLGSGIWGASGSTILINNAYYNSGWKYANSSNEAAIYVIEDSQHKWFTAPSGTAGAAITFTQAMTLNASGRLLLGTITDNGTDRLQVSGSSVFSGNIGWGGISPTGNTGISNTLESSNGSQIAARISVPQLYISSNVSGTPYAPTRAVAGYATQLLLDSFGGTISLNRAITSTAGSSISWISNLGFDNTGTATFSSSVTATSLIKSGGTSAQILAADGSVITAGTNITISGGTISAASGGGVSPSGNVVSTSQTTSLATYGDLTTAGPSVTVTVGASGTCIVILTSSAMTASSGVEAYMGFAVSGATTVAANDAQAMISATRNAGDTPKQSAVFWVTGLTAGSNTFTSKYRSGTAGTVATFFDRNMIVLPI